jgi:hypothetical protein
MQIGFTIADPAKWNRFSLIVFKMVTVVVSNLKQEMIVSSNPKAKRRWQNKKYLDEIPVRFVLLNNQ